MVTIGTLGSHSALEVCEGATAEGLQNIVVAQRGREKPYIYYKKTEDRKLGVVDEILLVEKFSEITEKRCVNYLKRRNTVFVPNRSFAVYVGYHNIEKNFPVPIFGNKFLLRAEERNVEKNQSYLLERARIPKPKTFKPERIDKLVIVKVSEAKRIYERAFFFASDYAEYKAKSSEMIKKGVITKQALDEAVIEEFVVGAHFNFNFFYSPIHERLELLGIDTRRQTNLDGFLRLPADQQLELLKRMRLTTIEIGHIASTLRESFLEKVFTYAERLVETVKREYKHGLIGPFALQGAVSEEGGEEFYCFDVSFRIPGSPGTRFTPYSYYLFREGTSFGKRIAMEIKDAKKQERLREVVT